MPATQIARSSAAALRVKVTAAISLISLTLGPGIVAIGSLLASIYPATRLYLLLPIEAMRAV